MIVDAIRQIPMTPDQYANDLIRTVSKTGEFELASPGSLEWACSLDDQEIVDLYIQIRDESRRLEQEWRDEFVELVDIDEDCLPDPEF